MENLDEFTNELNKIRGYTNSNISKQDFVHMNKIIWINRVFLILGYSLAFLIPNPISMILISLYLTTSWTIVAHHICHGALNNVSGISNKYKSNIFAIGYRRFIDWPDCFYPNAWKYEHNVMHHCRTNECDEPDQISYKYLPKWLSKRSLPIKILVLLIIISTWKFHYYSYTTIQSYYERESFKGILFRKNFLTVLKKSILPYFLIHFVFIPLCFCLISTNAALFVLINRLGAELITNWHTFLIIVPNHTGADIALQKNRFQNKKDFYLRQITSSCNANTGGFWNDYLHGYLNYQIEHHIFPNLPPSQYIKIQPLVKELCRKFNVPYIQESIFIRIKKMFCIIVGKQKMSFYKRMKNL